MAKDIYHDLVIELLIKDGWTITHDPLLLAFGNRKVYVDIGAERLIAAEKGSEKIAVEIKSFLGLSAVDDLEKAVGQYRIHLNLLEEKGDNGRELFLAINTDTFRDFFLDPFGDLIRRKEKLNLLIFDSSKKEISQWLHAKN